MDTEILLIGANFALEYGLAMADALTLAVAEKHGADLLTCANEPLDIGQATVIGRAGDIINGIEMP